MRLPVNQWWLLAQLVIGAGIVAWMMFEGERIWRRDK